MCAVAAIRRCVGYLRHHGATSHTPLYSMLHNNKCTSVKSTDITKALRAAAAIAGPQVGFAPEEVSLCSMRTSSSMELIMSQLDTDTIRLVWRWRIN